MSDSIKFNLDEFDESLVQEVVEINPDANPMEAPPPVDDGVHRVKLSLVDNSFDKGTTNPKRGGEPQDFIKCQFTGQVIAEGTKNNNKRIFGRVNTLTFDGKNEMAHILLQIYGGKDNAQARDYVKGLNNYALLAKAFKKALTAEPIIKVRTQWVAQYNDAMNGEPAKYKTAKSGQASFPKDSSGNYRPVVEVPGHGEVTAQANIKDYFPDAS